MTLQTTTTQTADASTIQSRARVLRARLSRRLKMLRWLQRAQVGFAQRRTTRAMNDGPPNVAIHHVEAAMAALTRLGHVRSGRDHVRYEG